MCCVLLYCVLCVLVIVPVTAEDCEGVLTLLTHAGDTLEVREAMEELDMEAVAAEAAGCGCYQIYQGQKKEGKSFIVASTGNHPIPLGHVGSV